jgi:hypothetical protein
MISRAHKVLFLIMLVACVIMAAVLIRLRNRAQDRLQAEAAAAPSSIANGSSNAPTEVTLYMPNDLDASLTSMTRTMALPEDRNAEARVLLDNLVAAFGAAGSTHPMTVVAGVNEVYFLPVPQSNGQEAVVNMPDVTEVHFLVDGQARDTLAGHADLTRTYLAAEANPEPVPAPGSGSSGAAGSQ